MWYERQIEIDFLLNCWPVVPGAFIKDPLPSSVFVMLCPTKIFFIFFPRTFFLYCWLTWGVYCYSVLWGKGVIEVNLKCWFIMRANLHFFQLPFMLPFLVSASLGECEGNASSSGCPINLYLPCHRIWGPFASCHFIILFLSVKVSC